MQENSKRIKIEKELKHYLHAEYNSMGLRTFDRYLKILKDLAYARLLQEQQTEKEILILTGELRILQKLLDVLELREVPGMYLADTTSDELK